MQESATRGVRGLVPFWAATAAALLAAVSALAADSTGTSFAVAPPGPGGATALALAPNLSFTDDSSSNFPIRGENLDDGEAFQVHGRRRSV